MSKPILRVTDTNLQNFVRRDEETRELILQEWRDEGSQEMMEQLRINTPVKRGILRESINRRYTPRGFSVFFMKPYDKIAMYLEKGTRPHRIFPVRAKFLHWVREFGTPLGDAWGADIFARSVNHPGFPGRFFIMRTAQSMKLPLKQLYEMIWEKWHQ